MTMPFLWPPFRDVPTSKTIDDIKRLTEEIMPKVKASRARLGICSGQRCTAGA